MRAAWLYVTRGKNFPALQTPFVNAHSRALRSNARKSLPSLKPGGYVRVEGLIDTQLGLCLARLRSASSG